MHGDCYNSGMPTKIADYEAHFWSKVDRSGDCWEWKGARRYFYKAKGAGYGRFHVERKEVSAHRYAWFLTHGEIPASMCVLHRCDNPACVNPSHLWLGTPMDNARDCVSKGRASGNKTGNPTLDLHTAIEAVRLYDSGVSQRDIAQKFGVTQTLISYYVTGKRAGVPAATTRGKRRKSVGTDDCC